jgi:prepilin-type N-terminal cleavage/methylation domain-containing protein
MKNNTGFTLAEVLIALALLGVIAAFAIPKVLQSTRNVQDLAIAKEAIASVSQAYQLYKKDKTLTANTRSADLTAYINNSTLINDLREIDNTLNNPFVAANSIVCNQSGGGLLHCLQLPNGAVLAYNDPEWFDGTDPQKNLLVFSIDTDGHFNNQPPVTFGIYYNGRTCLAENFLPNSAYANGPFGAISAGPIPNSTPAWFSWN